MTYEQALETIHGLLRFGMKPGLDRMRELLRRMGNPQEKLRFVHVAGTNGKGSTCAMVSSVLRAAGYRTGLYISPYVTDFCERIQVNGEKIPHQALADTAEPVFAWIREMREQGEIITEFEAVTAIAFQWFLKQSCDVVVLEVGMGGRFDATNVIPPPLVSAICAIDLDHTAILGDTLSQIAFEKCGIIKENGITVSYPQQHKEAADVIKKIASQRHNRLLSLSLQDFAIRGEGLDGSDIAYRGLPIHIPFAGRHQVYNTATVLGIVEALRARGICLPDQAVQEGIAASSFPARLELLGKHPLVLLDGAHNPAGMATLAQTVQKHLRGKKITGIMGMLADKDYLDALSLAGPLFHTLFTLTPDNPRALKAEELAKSAAAYCAGSFPCKTADEAVQRAFQTVDEDGAIVACGSLYLAGELRPKLMEYIQKRQKGR